jgi:hypothetical protein
MPQTGSDSGIWYGQLQNIFMQLEYFAARQSGREQAFAIRLQSR